ncbi:hypothetical protein PAPYR_7648 [Paratrimastix pyriformis]|uniref:Uncharacterized protein n=1 Tax=Paratrimastix pyriformis TaxID=342808 RepID=A0ABQ8UH30_9EUKA|nr:hypothetical protein PAPYR_7648 [Paratrimastix pyriformis]
MISEPRKIKLLESVVEAGKRWKLVKLLDVCDWFAVFLCQNLAQIAEYLFELAWGVNTRKTGTYASSTPNNQVPMLTTARTRRHQGVWGLLTPGEHPMGGALSALFIFARNTSPQLPTLAGESFPIAGGRGAGPTAFIVGSPDCRRMTNRRFNRIYRSWKSATVSPFGTDGSREEGETVFPQPVDGDRVCWGLRAPELPALHAPTKPVKPSTTLTATRYSPPFTITHP